MVYLSKVTWRHRGKWLTLRGNRINMNKIKYHILSGLVKTLGSLPLPALYRLGDMVAYMAEKVIHYRSDIVLMNLSRSYPDKKYKEISRMSHEFYRHFGEIFAETVWMAGCRKRPERFADAHIVRVTNPEVINRLFSDTPGVMLVTGHIGNWELTGAARMFDFGDIAPVFEDKDIMAVYKQLHDPVMDRIMKDIRSSVASSPLLASQLIESRDFIRAVASRHNEKHIWYSINDQHPYKGAAYMELEFMHQPTRTMTATYRIASKYQFSILYMSIRRIARGHYEYTLIPIAEDASRMSLEDMVQKNYQLMQADLEAQPSLYLWSHKRWK